MVAIGHMGFERGPAVAQDFAVSAAAGTFLGPFGFAIMSVGAVLASASAINADFFGAGKLPPLLAAHRELPSAFQRQVRGQSLTSLAVIGLLALVAVNFVEIHALSSATSGGFLLVYAAVNLAAIRLRHETGVSLLHAVAGALALPDRARGDDRPVPVLAGDRSPRRSPSPPSSLLSLLIELAFRLFDRQPAST